MSRRHSRSAVRFVAYRSVLRFGALDPRRPPPAGPGTLRPGAPRMGPPRLSPHGSWVSLLRSSLFISPFFSSSSSGPLLARLPRPSATSSSKPTPLRDAFLSLSAGFGSVVLGERSKAALPWARASRFVEVHPKYASFDELDRRRPRRARHGRRPAVRFSSSRRGSAIGALIAVPHAAAGGTG